MDEQAKKELAERVGQTIEEIESDLDGLIQHAADSMMSIRGKVGWNRLDTFAAVGMNFLNGAAQEPLDEETREKNAVLLHAAIFRMAEALCDIRQEEQDRINRLTALFDGNRRTPGGL